jgi:2-iminobutanoate/2-iminopropanoate deaminase
MIERHEPTPIMHRVVKHGDTLYLGGVAATDKSLGFADQALQTLERIEKLLQQYGSSKQQILTATVYLTDFANKEALNGVWLSFFDSDSLPTRATVGVAQLAPGTLVEIVVTAAA